MSELKRHNAPRVFGRDDRPRGMLPMQALTDEQVDALLNEERIESCQDCGVEQPRIWTAPDALWVEVTGITDGSGILCPSCFEKRAETAGVGLIRWVPERIDAWRKERGTP